jgi:UPF0042 nucleotide-binding protein
MKKMLGTPAIVIITGLSGSGKTVALRALEDVGFFCVDNLPIALIDSFITIVSKNKETRKIGIGIDIREKGLLSGVVDVMQTLKNKCRTELLFLEAEEEVLQRRFKETRRPHPLGGNIEEAIRIERGRVFVLKEAADRVIDTSSFTPHQLRQFVTSLYREGKGKKLMTVVMISFGFKYGTPQNVDLLFDVRFLPNPHFVPALRALKGTDKKVSHYVLQKSVTKEFLSKLRNLIDFLIPHYIEEGRPHLTIGIGCTGGNHRSPALVEKMKCFFKKYPVQVSIVHRDIW